jgi:hypothetical protein
MAIPQLTESQLRSGFDKQVAYTLARDTNDGSEAIALGRVAGLAKQKGYDETAKAAWAKVLKLEPKSEAGADVTLPSLDDLYARFQANAASGAFDGFADGGVYAATPGLAFSNAMGSLAHMIDYLRRKDAALAGGEEVNIMDGGSRALKAMGLKLETGADKEMTGTKSWAGVRKADVQNQQVRM